jgi:hypothetical protein
LRQLTRPQFFGRKIAIDASMSLYQFMIAVRYDGAHTLTDADGETTSYEQSDFFVGYFFRFSLRLFFKNDVLQCAMRQSFARHVLPHDSAHHQRHQARVCV